MGLKIKCSNPSPHKKQQSVLQIGFTHSQIRFYKQWRATVYPDAAISFPQPQHHRNPLTHTDPATWRLNAACHIGPRTICRNTNSTRPATPSPIFHTKSPSVLALFFFFKEKTFFHVSSFFSSYQWLGLSTSRFYSFLSSIALFFFSTLQSHRPWSRSWQRLSELTAAPPPPQRADI